MESASRLKVWKQVVSHGRMLGMGVYGSTYSDKVSLRKYCFDEAHVHVILDPGHAMYVQDSFYVGLDLFWADMLDFGQIIIVTKIMRLGPIMGRTMFESIARVDDAVSVDRHSTICAWCLKKGLGLHPVPEKTTCEVFLREKQALQDSRTMWLRWSQVARLWLPEDIVQYGGRLLVKTIC